MHQGAITDELPDSYSGATTFSTAMSKQPSQPSNPTPQQDKEEPDQMQYAALSFGGGASAKGGGARAMPKSNQDDMVTYSTVETKGSMQLKENVAPSREVVHSREHVQLCDAPSREVVHSREHVQLCDAPSREVVHSREHVQLWEEHVQNKPLLEKERNTSASPENAVTSMV